MGNRPIVETVVSEVRKALKGKDECIYKTAHISAEDVAQTIRALI